MEDVDSGRALFTSFGINKRCKEIKDGVQGDLRGPPTFFQRCTSTIPFFRYAEPTHFAYRTLEQTTLHLNIEGKRSYFLLYF